MEFLYEVTSVQGDYHPGGALARLEIIIIKHFFIRTIHPWLFLFF